MNCDACHNPIPDDMIACPRCAEENGKKAIRDYQLNPLRKVYAGEAQLTTRAIRGVRHVEVFGGYRRAFCWTPVSTGDRKDSIAWTEDDLNRICPGCRKVLTRLMEMACRTSA
jgi:hypothetical protein